MRDSSVEHSGGASRRLYVWGLLPGSPMSPTDDVWRQRLQRLLRPAWLGTLRRITPLSRRWGADRGTPIDRWYIERFLEAHRGDIHGRVLEVKDAGYARRFGRELS